MDNIKYDDFKNICRTCTYNCDLKPIHQDIVITEVLHNLTGVSFDINDKLPQQICQKCYEKINEIHAFTFQCKHTHFRLTNCLKEHVNNQQIKEEITIEEHTIDYNKDVKPEIINNELIKTKEIEHISIKQEFNESDNSSDSNINSLYGADFRKISEPFKPEVTENTKPRNSIKSEQYVSRQFQKFCADRNYQLNGNTSNEELALILKDWAFNMRKNDGSEYKEGVVKTMWNVTAKMVQQKYFKEFHRTINPFKDIVFQSAVLAKIAKRKNLQANPTKRKSSAVTLNTEDIQKIIETCDENTPSGLQRKFYHIAAVELAWHHHSEAVSCLLDYFTDEIDNYGVKTGRFQYNTVFSKTATQGANKKTTDIKWLTPNENNPNNCPVRLLKKMIAKRTKNIKTRRLFLTVNKDWCKYPDSSWYKNMPLGVNEISKWTKLGAEALGLDTKRVKITNHSNRSTIVSQLSSAGTSVQEII